MIFVDANILMYAAGSPYPHKIPSLNLLRKIASQNLPACTDAETFQEILHRYRSIGRWEDGRKLFLDARKIISTIYPVTIEMLDMAVDLLVKHPTLMARDGLHAAGYFLHNADVFCSYDRDFDAISGLRRVTPAAILR